MRVEAKRRSGSGRFATTLTTRAPFCLYPHYQNIALPLPSLPERRFASTLTTRAPFCLYPHYQNAVLLLPSLPERRFASTLTTRTPFCYYPHYQIVVLPLPSLPECCFATRMSFCHYSLPERYLSLQNTILSMPSLPAGYLTPYPPQ